MKSKINLLIISLFILLSQSCSKPRATVFKDERLSQEESVKFCLLGDVGRGTELQQKIADTLETEDCDRIFFLGDLVYPSGVTALDDPELEDRFLKYYRPLVERDPGLIISYVLGNHDHKGNPAVWKDVPNLHPGFFFPHYYYMIDYGGLCVVGLDTSFYYYADKVPEATEQATWLAQLEPRLKECDVKVALTHHPLKGDGHPGSMDWTGASGPLKGFLETSIIGKFDMHVSGHVHILHDDGEDEGTKLLISGTGGEILGGGNPGYVILRWEPQNPKRIGYSFRQIDTEVNVYSDDLGAVQEQEADSEYEHTINKTKVEAGLISRMINSLKAFFFGLISP